MTREPSDNLLGTCLKHGNITDFSQWAGAGGGIMETVFVWVTVVGMANQATGDTQACSQSSSE